jgi:BirA family biotin operon repressor/biotin-[acetyl-CoA-carboxylase] ligase
MLLRAPADGFRCLSAAPIRVGVLTVRALRESAQLEARLKWPNDLQVGGRKLAGILCESVLDADPFLVVGIGVNVGQRAEDFPPELQGSATSVFCCTGRRIGLSQLAGAITRHLLMHANRIAEPFDPREIAELSTLDALRGYPVTVDEKDVGRGFGIDERGVLLVQNGGHLQEIHSGTVRVVPDVSDTTSG